MTASEVAAAVGGELEGPDVVIDGATIDSRRVIAGQLFVPIVAERDGHDFVADAMGAGAIAYLTSRPPVGGTAIVAADTAAALSQLGVWARSRLPDRVVGITGSTGKTSTKDILGSVLSAGRPCAVSEGNHNNELGVPLTLINAPTSADAAVVEMGARGIGQIRALCDVARPTVGIVTNVSAAHTEFLGDVETVALTKAELIESLGPSGTAVLNAGDPRVAAMATMTPAATLTFGVDVGDVRATGVFTDAELRPSFALETPWGSTVVHLSLRGAHQAANAAAAAAAALALDVDLGAIADGLSRTPPAAWRMEVARAPDGTVVINDAYNSSPAAAEAALAALAAVDARRRIAVLGPMLELGDVSAEEHRRIGSLAESLGIEVIAVGTAEYGIPPVADADAAFDRLARNLAATTGDKIAVLVKASRAAGLERIADGLLTGLRGPNAIAGLHGARWSPEQET